MSMFGFLPHNLFTNHRGADTSGLSPRLWAPLSSNIMTADGSSRLVLAGDDFVCVRNSDTYTRIRSEMHYSSYIDTGGTLLNLADEKGGVLALTTDGTDEDEIWMVCGDGTGGLGMISDTSGDDHMTAFECRYKINTIANSAMSHFVGLTTPMAAAAEMAVDATGALKATTSILGFRTLLDGDNIEFVYQAVADSAVVIAVASAKVPVADTFMKLGFLYDPSAPAAKRIKVFADNVELSTYVTATQIATATFPDAEQLTFQAGYKNTTAAAGELAIDWWAFGQIIT